MWTALYESFRKAQTARSLNVHRRPVNNHQQYQADYQQSRAVLAQEEF